MGALPGAPMGLSAQDKRSLTLLVVLYLLQGVPVGLAFGSIPYILRSKLSYSQIGIFTLSTYPYSLKLLWSPIVDSYFHPKIGRRKSWILPIQTIVGFLFWWLSLNVDSLFDVEVPAVGQITFIFFMLVFMAATQDIAVDGWALTLVPKRNLSYTSTAQTIGLNTGYFLSFTVFLAFNSVEFSNKYFRSVPSDTPLITLSGYLRFWAVVFWLVTAYVALNQPEDPIGLGTQDTSDDEMDIKKVYKVMWSIIRLPHIQTFLAVHLVCKLGMAANEAATSLKMVEKGLSKEDLGLAVLIDFPFQILFGYLAAKWSRGKQPLRPWLSAMYGRLIFAVVAMLIVSSFPASGQVSTTLFVIVILSTVASSFATTVSFVGINAFHAQISDPMIGGTYMTLLNTFSNLGGTWPRFFVLSGIDHFTDATCHVPDHDESEVLIRASECVSEHGKSVCSDLGGECVTERDGYYLVSSLCVVAGVALFLFYIGPRIRKLEGLPAAAWRVHVGSNRKR